MLSYTISIEIDLPHAWVKSEPRGPTWSLGRGFPSYATTPTALSPRVLRGIGASESTPFST